MARNQGLWLQRSAPDMRWQLTSGSFAKLMTEPHGGPSKTAVIPKAGALAIAPTKSIMINKEWTTSPHNTAKYATRALTANQTKG